MLQRGMRSFSVVQLGLGQLAHLRVGQQQLGLGLGALRLAQLADARDHRLDVGQLLGGAGRSPRRRCPRSASRAARRRGAAMRSSLMARFIAAVRGQLRERDLAAARRCEVLHLGDAPRQLGVAEDHRGARADAVGALHPALEVAAIADLGADAGVPQRLEHVDRRRLGRLARPG